MLDSPPMPAGEDLPRATPPNGGPEDPVADGGGATEGAGAEATTAWIRAWIGPAGAVAASTVALVVIAGTAAVHLTGSEFPMWASSPRYLWIMTRFFVAVLVLRSIVTRRLPRWPQLVDMAGVLLLMTALVAGYTTLKVHVPLINEARWDAAMAALDRALCLGIDPNVFLVTILSQGPRWLGPAIDQYYYSFVTLFVVFAAWYLADPSPRNRSSFAAGWIVLWGAGALLYVAFPVLGPVFFTRSLWQEVAGVFPFAAALQAALLKNYLAVVSGQTRHIVQEYGIAAMPSLHVATHAYLWLWARRIGSRWAPLFLAMTLATWFCSVATGWHYMVDGLVGLLVAWAAARLALGLREKGPSAHDVP